MKPPTDKERPGHQSGSRSIVWELRRLIPITALPLAGLVFVQTYSSYRQANNAAQQFVLRQAERVVNEVGSFLRDTERGLRLVAGRAGVAALDPAHCDPGLGDLIGIEPRYANVNVIDRQGWVICSARPPPGGPRSVNVSERDWFQAVMSGKPFALGKVRQGPILGRWISSAAVPIAGASGEIAGMVVTAIDLQAWSSAKGPLSVLPADSILGVMEKTGRLVLRSPEPEKWVGRDSSKERIYSDLMSTGVRVCANVMVVDDEAAIVAVFAELLEKIGCNVTGLTSSTEALRLFQANPYCVDMVITDQTMPDLIGTDLARAMLALRTDIPIIMSTGYSASIDEETALKIGLRQPLLKPVPAKVLIEVVARHLNLKTHLH